MPKFLPVIDLGFGPDLDQDMFGASSEEAIGVDATEIVSGKITPQTVLTRSLKAIRRSKQYEQLIYEWPFLHDACLRMANWISPVAPSVHGVLLLHLCLNKALEAYKHTAVGNFPPLQDPYIRLRSFILTASQYFHESLSHQIYGRIDGGWSKWKPFESPLMEWITSNEYTQLLVLPASVTITLQEGMAARNKLMYEIFDFNSLTLAGVVTADDEPVSESSNI